MEEREKDITKNKEKKEMIRKEMLYILRTIVITSVCVFMTMKFFFRPVRVSGESMYPTLKDSNFGFSNVLGGILKEYERFDVVVVDPLDKALNPKDKDSFWVKRIVGLPNETIEYRDDKLYVNGKYIKESYFDKAYVKKKTYDGDLNFTDDFGPITLKEDEYFLLGDNRGESYDSRFAGPFTRNQIVSKSIIVLYPFDSIGVINH